MAYKIKKKKYMKKEHIFLLLFLAGIGWAAWNDLSRVEPDWKKDPCHTGISYSLHQREEDDRWVIGFRNGYVERLAVQFEIEWDGGRIEKAGLLRQGETAYFPVEPGDGASARVTGLYYADPEGNVGEEIKGCE